MLTCIGTVQETHDVRTFTFSAASGELFCFEPGQFITLDVDMGAARQSRCYTVSSSPTRPFTLSITVKRVANGPVSNWLHDNLRPGDAISAYGPSGAFTASGVAAQRYLFFSAGSGVTPLMSMVRAAADLDLDRDVVFMHSARTPGDIIFREELQRLARRHPQLKVLNIVEGVGDEPAWDGPVGRLDLAVLQAQVADWRAREVFVCGPGPYMQAVRDMLMGQGFDMSRYHCESFSLGGVAPLDAGNAAAPPPMAGAELAAFSVRFSKSGAVFSARQGETVLGAAKRSGVAIASSCSQGICGTCKAQLLEGRVDMQHGGGIRQREIDKGMRLMCCSKPLSDIVIDL
ncbi:2Fe-2S iron-sulfur cluster-binding protein [Pseudomonas sp. S37]|uniref:2Fe-2S iron-sulfur cluster-binding protein n=1 Tax=Pseudomonas sp. S37 TaxID=2767449 RepID=UPI001F35BA61|nr:2Fe-2S iron-sulfur cluster-binding protein [Pseudomonas sp. S37]